MRMRIISPRPARFDELGLRRALADRMVPFQIAAMAFLAALAIAGWMGAAVLTGHWESGAGSTLTVQVPTPAEPNATGTGTRLDAVRGVADARPRASNRRTFCRTNNSTLCCAPGLAPRT